MKRVIASLFACLMTLQSVQAIIGVDILSYELTEDALAEDCQIVTNGLGTIGQKQELTRKYF